MIPKLGHLLSPSVSFGPLGSLKSFAIPIPVAAWVAILWPPPSASCKAWDEGTVTHGFLWLLAILFDDPDACALPDLFFLFSLITISLASWSWICFSNEFGADWMQLPWSFELVLGPALLDMINGSGSGSCNRVDFLNLRFYHFHFHMCFAPQHRAFSEHLNFQKCSDTKVFSTCVLPNVLRATTPCTFSTSPLPKLFRNFLTSKSASRQNGVTTACNFSSLIWPDGSAPAALASLLFDPPEPQSIGKTQCLATFLPFRAPASSFFWLSLSLCLLPFFLWLLPLVLIVGISSSKLPSARSVMLTLVC